MEITNQIKAITKILRLRLFWEITRSSFLSKGKRRQSLLFAEQFLKL